MNKRGENSVRADGRFVKSVTNCDRFVLLVNDEKLTDDAPAEIDFCPLLDSSLTGSVLTDRLSIY